MNAKPVQFFALVLLAAVTVTARGEEMQGSLKVSGNEVEIQVQFKDGRPAAGLQIRLLDANQRTAAGSRTDQSGRWFTAVRSPGRYQAIVESEREGEENLCLPFTVLGNEEPRAVPWSTLFLGLACLVSAGFLFLAGVRKPAGICLFAVVGITLFGWSAWAAWLKPVPSVFTDPDIAKEAREFLRTKNVKPLSDSLMKLLEDDGNRVKTQPHPLIGKAAPDFTLADHRETKWRLQDRLKKGPVVLVFYYGYHCNHCVGQLFALHDDVAPFRELSAEIVAVSADPPELTRERFKKFGEFAFSVLADPGNKIAQLYSVFLPASGKTPENLQHGTFVIGRDGVIQWAQYGDEPFTGNRTLLYELAKMEGRLP